MGAQGNQTMSDTVSQAMPTQPALIDGVNEDGHNRGYADYPETPWGRSTAFQSIFSNFFQYRVGHGEIALMLGTITTQPTSAGMPIIEQQTEVFMTWVQMKNLVQTMQTVLQMIELEVGPIPVVPRATQKPLSTAFAPTCAI